jgi:hypothetical protein
MLVRRAAAVKTNGGGQKQFDNVCDPTAFEDRRSEHYRGALYMPLEGLDAKAGIPSYEGNPP